MGFQDELIGRRTAGGGDSHGGQTISVQDRLDCFNSPSFVLVFGGSFESLFVVSRQRRAEVIQGLGHPPRLGRQRLAVDLRYFWPIRRG